MQIILRQIEVTGCRERTLYDYKYTISKFVQATKAIYVLDITNDLIYKWLESMEVSNQTKLTRLKCLSRIIKIMEKTIQKHV